MKMTTMLLLPLTLRDHYPPWTAARAAEAVPEGAEQFSSAPIYITIILSKAAASARAA